MRLLEAMRAEVKGTLHGEAYACEYIAELARRLGYKVRVRVGVRVRVRAALTLTLALNLTLTLALALTLTLTLGGGAARGDARGAVALPRRW